MFNNRVNKSNYNCSYCGRYIPISFQFQHDIRCHTQKKMFEEIDTFKYKCKLCGQILKDILDTKRMEHLSFHQSNRNEYIHSNIVNNAPNESNNEENRNNNSNNNIDMSTITLGGNNHNIIFRYQNINMRNRRNSMDNNYINRISALNNSSSDNSNNNSFSDNQENKSSKDLDNFSNNPNYAISKIKDPKKLSENKKKCLICLEKFRKGEESIILPCIHMFHSTCIKKWMKIKDFCPLCKKSIKYKKNIKNK